MYVGCKVVVDLVGVIGVNGLLYCFVGLNDMMIDSDVGYVGYCVSYVYVVLGWSDSVISIIVGIELFISW